MLEVLWPTASSLCLIFLWRCRGSLTWHLRSPQTSASHNTSVWKSKWVSEGITLSETSLINPNDGAGIRSVTLSPDGGVSFYCRLLLTLHQNICNKHLKAKYSESEALSKHFVFQAIAECKGLKPCSGMSKRPFAVDLHNLKWDFGYMRTQTIKNDLIFQFLCKI